MPSPVAPQPGGGGKTSVFKLCYHENPMFTYLPSGGAHQGPRHGAAATAIFWGWMIDDS